MKIAIRMEGGAGDHLLANRFAFAIREKYPDASLHLFSDTEGKTFQTELLALLYPNVYDSVKVIPNKERKPFLVKNQFNESEDYISHYDNIPVMYRDLMENAHDKFYDLHIDSLKFTEYDFDWQRYFRFFPKPTKTFPTPKDGYITVHLRSTSNRANDLRDWYVQAVLRKLGQVMPVRVIATEEDKFFYGELPENCTFVIGALEKVVETIAGGKFFLSVDSGFTYVAYCYNVPTLTYNAFCPQPHQVAPHQIMRWTIFPERILPLNFDAGWVAKKVEAIIRQPGLAILPQLQDFDLQAVKRHNQII